MFFMFSNQNWSYQNLITVPPGSWKMSVGSIFPIFPTFPGKRWFFPSFDHSSLLIWTQKNQEWKNGKSWKVDAILASIQSVRKSKKNEHVAAILAPFQEVAKTLKNADANLASFQEFHPVVGNDSTGKKCSTIVQLLIIPPFGAEWHAFCSIVSHITQHRLSSHRATQRFVNTWRLDSQFNPTSPLHTMLLLPTFKALTAWGANENLQRQWWPRNPSMRLALYFREKTIRNPGAVGRITCIHLQSRSKPKGILREKTQGIWRG